MFVVETRDFGGRDDIFITVTPMPGNKTGAKVVRVYKQANRHSQVSQLPQGDVLASFVLQHEDAVAFSKNLLV